MLDKQLAKHGQTAIFHRVLPDGSTVARSLRVFLRGYTPNELAGGIQQGDSAVTISGTGWKALGFDDLPERNEALTVAGRMRNIEYADPVVINDVMVRINLQVRG